MPTVYVVNQPSTKFLPKDENGNVKGKLPDISGLMAFGEIKFVFNADREVPSRRAGSSIQHAHYIMERAQPGDFLAWTGGDPFGMVLAASILSDVTDGKFIYLVWDRELKSYSPVPVDLFKDND